MAIPKHNEIRRYALELLKDRNERRPREFEKPLAIQFNLTDEEVDQMYDSGNGPVFFDRICWALSYLSMAGLVVKPKRGVYKISEKGLELLATPEKIEEYVHEFLQLI